MWPTELSHLTLVKVVRVVDLLRRYNLDFPGRYVLIARGAGVKEDDVRAVFKVCLAERASSRGTDLEDVNNIIGRLARGRNGEKSDAGLPLILQPVKAAGAPLVQCMHCKGDLEWGHVNKNVWVYGPGGHSGGLAEVWTKCCLRCSAFEGKPRLEYDLNTWRACFSEIPVFGDESPRVDIMRARPVELDDASAAALPTEMQSYIVRFVCVIRFRGRYLPQGLRAFSFHQRGSRRHERLCTRRTYLKTP